MPRYRPQGKPIHRAERRADPDVRISTPYHAEYRGLVQDYLLAFNVHRLWRRHRVMESSLGMTLAHTFKPKARQMYQTHRQSVATSHGTLKGLAGTVDRGKPQNPTGSPLRGN